MLPEPVIVTGYDPEWPVWFEALARVYRRALSGLGVTVEHVGSTSVPGLAAKPILDIDLVIPSSTVLPEVRERLAALGYRHEGDRGIRGRESFACDDDDVPRDGNDVRPELRVRWPAHHLYVCVAGASELERHLRFRDWLRAHPDDADAYARLKRRLAEVHGDDREHYTDGKSELIERILSSAGRSRSS